MPLYLLSEINVTLPPQAPPPTRTIAWTPGELFQVIRAEPGISRSTLARETGLAPTSITSRISKLIDHNLVSQSGGGRGGRTPRALSVNSDWGIVLSVQIGSAHIRLTASNMNGEVLAASQREESLGSDVIHGINWLETVTQEMFESVDSRHGPLRGIGISVRSPVSSTTGQLTGSTYLADWNEVPIAAVLSERFHVPVQVSNDATLMALGELRRSGSGVHNMIFLKIGTAVGSGIIINGESFQGSSGGAGEVCHFPTDLAWGRPCVCGRSDCLEANFGGAGLVELLTKRGVEISGVPELTTLARQADQTVLEVLREAGTAIGMATAVLADFINPDRIVLGGRLSEFEVLTQALRSAFYGRALPLTLRDVEITESITRTDAASVGAAWSIIDFLFAADHVNTIVNGPPAPLRATPISTT